jgi:predicted RNase H-like HicB family nuclease
MKDLDYYEGLPYQAVWEHAVTADGDRYWRVHLQEIPAVAGLGTTEEEALEQLRERFEEYVRFRVDEGLDISEPGPSAKPSVADAPPVPGAEKP